jgi:serine phosphatase RsbU (regulator of sigma subunit)
VFSLLLYTDGVIEGRVRALPGERFGEQRLIDLLTAASSGGRELLQQILLSATSAHGGPLPDDAALLLLERDPTASSPVRRPAPDRLQA